MEEKVETELKLFFTTEMQAKFLPNFSPDEINSFLNRIKTLFLFGGYNTSKINLLSNEDSYYDTQAGDLAKSGNTLRIRIDGAGCHYSIKRTISKIRGLYERREIEDSLTRAELNDLKNSNFDSLVKTYLSDFSGKKIVEIGVVVTKRLQFDVCKDDETLKVRMDVFWAKMPVTKARSESRVELEIEAVSDKARERLKEIQEYVEEIFPELRHSYETKYSFVYNFFQRKSESLLQKLHTLFSENKKLAAIAAILAVAGSIASIIGLFKS